MNAPLTAWVISDGRRGIENQALGLAQAMKRQRSLSFQSHTIKHSWLFTKLPAWTQFKLRKNPASYVSEDDHPDIAIGCGRQAIAPLLALKHKFKDDICTIYIQHPRLDPSYFDMVVAPQHDQLAGPNVISIIGSPNLITKDRLKADQHMLSMPKAKIAAWLIGGHSKTHKLRDHDHKNHLSLLKDLKSQGWHILVSTSRRTPEAIINDYTQLTKTSTEVDLFKGDGENPYFAFLYHADKIFVTEDSTNMLTEACATGKPVFRLSMTGKAGKFQKLYDVLETRCHVRPATGSDLSSVEYEPLNETAVAAEKVWMAFDKKFRPLA